MKSEVENDTEYVMTPKEVTDSVSVQDSKATAKVEELAKEESVGTLSKKDNGKKRVIDYSPRWIHVFR